MSSGHDEGPVYYREIQKNAYLKRIPNDSSGSKLRPLGHKKPPLKPMWTLFCVHNGRSPYLEQYPLAECPATMSHKPVWRACLKTARHVTASVKPHAGLEYDFLVDTDHGPVRMVAPDWDSMQDWVTTLRNKLHELRILSKGENVYCPAPAAPLPRAAARDPTSPLPPTPPVPPDRVPGIELVPPSVPIPQIPEPPPDPEPIDISSWEEDPTPSTSQSEPRIEPKSVAKICGQNICLDDSILKRNVEDTDSDGDGDSGEGFKQRVLVEDNGELVSTSHGDSDRQATNITVIQVSNKGPPHTAIPVLGPETVFNFNIPTADTAEANFVNIVNTEVNISQNGFGSVFTDDSDYGHLSLTTTVNLTERTDPVCDESTVNVSDGVYERLCMASTSNEAPLAKVKSQDRLRKSSLPNLDSVVNNESTYEFLYPSESVNNNRNTTVMLNSDNTNGRVEINSNDVASSLEQVSLSCDSRVLRSNVERSHSQNACDSARAQGRVRQEVLRRMQNNSPKRETRNDKTESAQTKPIWKRGLTELSLLTRLRGIGQGRRHESPTRHEEPADRVTSPAKVVHRSRAEGRSDSSRRRSSSLSNGQSPVNVAVPSALVPLRRRQALALQGDQRRRAALPAAVPALTPPLLADYDKSVWIAWWAAGGGRCSGRCGDRLAAVRGAQPRDAHHARQLLKTSPSPVVDILFHRVPLAKIYVLNKRDHENIGIKLDNECNIVSVDSQSPAGRAGIPPPGKWALTEVNNRPINLIKGGEEEMARLSAHGTEVSLLIQPSALVKKLRAVIKANKTLLSIR